MRTLTSLFVIGAGAYAYALMRGNRSRRWMNMANMPMFAALMPKKRTMKRIRKQMTKAFT